MPDLNSMKTLPSSSINGTWVMREQVAAGDGLFLGNERIVKYIEKILFWTLAEYLDGTGVLGVKRPLEPAAFIVISKRCAG